MLKIKEKWELFKSYMPEDKNKQVIIVIVSLFLLGFIIPALFFWFILPVDKFINSKKKFYIFWIIMACLFSYNNITAPKIIQ